MNGPGKLATLAVTAVAVGGLSGGIAFAQSSHSSRPIIHRPAAAAETAAPDTDNVQEGDQTSPDPTAAAKAATAVRPAVHLATPAKRVAPATARAVTNTAQSGQESESSGESENSAQGDGPGGHQDPPGDVQHEGDNTEQ